jgi:hypothetical protein
VTNWFSLAACISFKLPKQFLISDFLEAIRVQVHSGQPIGLALYYLWCSYRWTLWIACGKGSRPLGTGPGKILAWPLGLLRPQLEFHLKKLVLWMPKCWRRQRCGGLQLRKYQLPSPLIGWERRLGLFKLVGPQ